MNNLGSKTIETERLILKSQTMNEQKRLWSILMNPEVNKYYLNVPKKLRLKLLEWEKQELFYQQEINNANNLDVYKWSIFLKDGNECIGRISCHERSTEDSNVNDPSIRGVGWYLDPNYQGNGYGTEAAIAVMDYMFHEVEIDEIITGAAICNPASWKIMERFGFIRQDKTDFVEYTFQDELVEDYRYVMTKEMYIEKCKNKKR